jgi:hypothetical protein
MEGERVLLVSQNDQDRLTAEMQLIEPVDDLRPLHDRSRIVYDRVGFSIHTIARASRKKKPGFNF